MPFPSQSPLDHLYFDVRPTNSSSDHSRSKSRLGDLARARLLARPKLETEGRYERFVPRACRHFGYLGFAARRRANEHSEDKPRALDSGGLFGRWRFVVWLAISMQQFHTTPILRGVALIAAIILNCGVAFAQDRFSANYKMVGCRAFVDHDTQIP